MFGKSGIVQKLKKAMVERMLEAEMLHHLGYEKHGISKDNGNYRNGKTSKKLITGCQSGKICFLSSSWRGQSGRILLVCGFRGGFLFGISGISAKLENE